MKDPLDLHIYSDFDGNKKVGITSFNIVHFSNDIQAKALAEEGEVCKSGNLSAQTYINRLLANEKIDIFVNMLTNIINKEEFFTKYSKL